MGDVGEENKTLKNQLEQKTHEVMKTKALLEEKEMEVHLLKQETQQVILAVVWVCKRSVSVEKMYVSKGKGFKHELHSVQKYE